MNEKERYQCELRLAAVDKGNHYKVSIKTFERAQKRQQNGNCYYWHQLGHFKAECPECQLKAQGASTPRSAMRDY